MSEYCGDGNFEAMVPRIRAFRAHEIPPPEMLISPPDLKYKIYYLPFEYVNRGARIVLVGITPGPSQLAIAYSEAVVLQQRGLSPEQILEQVKIAAGFRGQMRSQLIKLLDFMEIPKLLAINDSASLWSNNSRNVTGHSTVVSGRCFVREYCETVFLADL